MDVASWVSVSSVVCLIVGAAAGAAAGHFLSPAIGEAKKLRADLDRLQHEHEAYRGSVNSHFRKTADLVGQMTKSYAAVYDHLAGGARRFCDDSDSATAVPFDPLPGALASPVIETAAGEPVETATVEPVAAASDVAVEDGPDGGDGAGDLADTMERDDVLADVAADDGATGADVREDDRHRV